MRLRKIDLQTELLPLNRVSRSVVVEVLAHTLPWRVRVT
jgi:hypothetical protein